MCNSSTKRCNMPGKMNERKGDKKNGEIDKRNFSPCAERSTPLTEFERVKLYRYRRGSDGMKDREERAPRGRGFLLTLGASLCSNYRGLPPTRRACPPTRFDLFRFRLTARYSRLFLSVATRFLLVLRCPCFHPRSHKILTYICSMRRIPDKLPFTTSRRVPLFINA